jgi:hypothetical protein
LLKPTSNEKNSMHQVLEKHIQTSSDINEHLPILLKYSQKCNSILEFGIRDVVSTWAFIEGLPKKGKYIGVDIYTSPNLPLVAEYAKEKKIEFTFYNRSSLEKETIYSEVDFIFIDTMHRYLQLKYELEMHGNTATKYIGFHDVVTFGYVDELLYANTDLRLTEESFNKGLLPAIMEFMIKNPKWKIDYFSFKNNGLLILAKV